MSHPYTDFCRFLLSVINFAHEIEALLPSHLFKRIHRSFIVALSRIDSYTADSVEVNGIPIPIGRDYRDSIKDL